MDIRDYEYIVAIAEQGSISRAAAQLFITQPALTKFLQRTERELGLPLFLRRGNQFLLTEAGQKYVETGRAIMHLDRLLSEQLSEEVQIQNRQIRLGFSMGRTDEMLDQVLPLFHAEYPEIKVTLKADTSRRQIMALQNRSLDLAMVTNVEHLPGYTHLAVGRSWLALAVPEDSPLLGEGREDEAYPFPVIAREKLNGLRFVSLPLTTNSGKLAKEMCGRQGIEMKTVLEVSDVRTMLDAVERGYGCAVVMSVPIGKRKIRYLCLEDAELIEQMTELVYRADLNLSRPVKYLIRLLTEKTG